MPAKPLTADQKRDAARLKAAFKLWQSSRRERGEAWTQDEVAELFGFGQSALSQYISGSIPLNATALTKFSTVMGVNAAMISPALVRSQEDLAAALRGTEPPAAFSRKRSAAQ